MRRNNLIRIVAVAGTNRRRTHPINYEKMIEEKIYGVLRVVEMKVQRYDFIRIAAVAEASGIRALSHYYKKKVFAINKKGAQRLGIVRIAALLSTTERRALPNVGVPGE